MTRLSNEEITQAEEKLIEEKKAKVHLLSKSLHEYGVLEAKSMSTSPFILTLASIRHAALNVVSCAMLLKEATPNVQQEFLEDMKDYFDAEIQDALCDHVLKMTGDLILQSIMNEKKEAKS